MKSGERKNITLHYSFYYCLVKDTQILVTFWHGKKNYFFLLYKCVILFHYIENTTLRYKFLKCQPTPVLLPGKSHVQRSLVDYSPWDRKESDTTERLHFHFQNNDSKEWPMSITVDSKICISVTIFQIDELIS